MDQYLIISPDKKSSLFATQEFYMFYTCTWTDSSGSYFKEI